MLYIRMFVIMIATLITSRIVLQKLGVDDFGVYNVVAGIALSLTIVTNTLSSAISRFITFELGRGDVYSLKTIVSTSINTQILLSVTIILLGETIGVWFLDNYINLPPGRENAANWIFQASLLIFVIRLLIVPFNALIVSHEDLKIFAYLSILDASLMLGISFCIGIIPGDRLIIYGWLLVFPPLLTLLIYIIYCRNKYEGFHYDCHFNWAKLREMIGFAGWNFLGSSSGVLKNQGVNIIVNMFAGVVANAARGVAAQLDNAINTFTGSFTTALNPQIIKSYSSGDLIRMDFLISFGARLAFYLMLFITLPILLETETILKIWLTDVPFQAGLFSQLQFLVSLITVLSCTLITGMMASGKIKKYQIIVSLATFSNFPMCIISLYIGCPIYSTYIIALGIEFISMYLRIRMANEILGISIASFYKEVVFNTFIVSIAALMIPLLIRLCMNESILRLVIVSIVSILSTSISIYSIGLNTEERHYLLKTMKQYLVPLKILRND